MNNLVNKKLDIINLIDSLKTARMYANQAGFGYSFDDELAMCIEHAEFELGELEIDSV